MIILLKPNYLIAQFNNNINRNLCSVNLLSIDLKTQTDSEIINDYKYVKIKLRISFIFLEFILKVNRRGN